MQIHMYTHTNIYKYINVHVTNLPFAQARLGRTPAVGMGQNPGTGSKPQWTLLYLAMVTFNEVEVIPVCKGQMHRN